MLYMTFGGRGEPQGGGHDYVGIYPTLEIAQEAALTLSWIVEPRLSTWLHIAEYDPGTGRFKVIMWLLIPETEQADWDDDEYEWREYVSAR